MSANYVERFAVAGAFFFGLQLWEGYRSQRSRDLFFAERAAGGALAALTLEQALVERRSVVGAPTPLLSVKDFGVENLEVRPRAARLRRAPPPAARRSRARPTPDPHKYAQGKRAPRNGTADGFA
jgi:hypothetical protein